MLDFIRKFIPDLEEALNIRCCYVPEQGAKCREQADDLSPRHGHYADRRSHLKKYEDALRGVCRKDFLVFANTAPSQNDDVYPQSVLLSGFVQDTQVRALAVPSRVDTPLPQDFNPYKVV
ncbi:MAG: hypothetical protein KDJ26_06720 [Alphaproteobacteria bacterium]|nr:hypothetical protein [Alphaproteobacteria bacterium]MCB9985486.1 hypothetical protein [Micavibrio sp.]HPQ51393.1 hypothetical protein [Alphaproteobacteria bacterium]